MRKRIILTFLIIWVFQASILAGPKTEALNLVGYAGNQCSLSISLDDTPLYRDTGVWSFDMDDTEVHKVTGASLVNGTGFRFASWSLISNTNQIILKINHDKLVNESDPSITVDYQLAVECSNKPFNELPYRYGVIFNSTDGPKYVNYSEASNDSFVAINNYGMFIRLDLTTEEAKELASGVYYSTISMEVNAL